jgi:ficolin
MSGGNADGVYMIDPGDEGAFPVYCDQTTDGGGWTVFQRRMDGAVDFYRTWEEYANGFGDLLREHWLGNEKLLRITNVFPTHLRIDLERFSGETSYATFRHFKLTTETDNKQTFSPTDNNGPAGDSMLEMRGKPFSTKNKNKASVAQVRHGGWWYFGGAEKSNLNGRYYSTAQQAQDGIFWHAWTGIESLKGTKMMIRSTGEGMLWKTLNCCGLGQK